LKHLISTVLTVAILLLVVIYKFQSLVSTTQTYGQLTQTQHFAQQQIRHCWLSDSAVKTASQANPTFWFFNIPYFDDSCSTPRSKLLITDVKLDSFHRTVVTREVLHANNNNSNQVKAVI